VIAPVFFAASVYVLLSRIVTLLGTRHSPINPHLIARIFVGGDMTAFFVQIAGAVLILLPSSTAQADTGLKVLLAGLAIQVVTIFVYLVLAVVVFIRNIYRVAEFWSGFDSSLSRVESTAYALDAGLILILAFLFNVVHPSYMLRQDADDGPARGDGLSSFDMMVSPERAWVGKA
ncbi:hypothetical protein M427DRAFT_35017, partial [Gonapodya prolifera JEL478]